MKLFILKLFFIALMSPVVSSFGPNKTAHFTYMATKSCGGYNCILSFKNCRDDYFCSSPVRQSTKGALVIKFGEDIQEPLFFQYNIVIYRHGKRIEWTVGDYNVRYLCNLIDCPIKKDVEYRLPFEIPLDDTRLPRPTILKPKDMIRMIATIDNVAGDVQTCAMRDVFKSG